MSGPPEETRDLHDHLAEVFLQDVGLNAGPSATPAALDDEEFGRIAIDLGLLSEQDLESARRAADATPGLRLWEQLTQSDVLDVGDVLSVFRFHSELCSYSSRNIGRYFVVERLGEGASGRVYRAIHQDLLKHVALKILNVQEDAPRSMVERFRREAATAASLRHPSIVGVHDVGVDGDLHYIAMDLVEGSTLSEWLATHPERDERLRVLEESARALGHAHREGVLHRDLKPQNILVREDGVPIVVDFGLARAATDATLTRDGAVLGTPQYMAPEQLRGEVTDLTPAADVYALGCVVYESLVGESPFSMSDAGWPVAPVVAPRFSAEARAHLGDALHTVCLQCLDPDPRYRYANAEELADELARVRGGMPVLAKAPSTWSAALRGVRRRPGWVATAVLLLAILVLGAKFGVELVEENRRLAYAGDVKTAYTVLRAQLQPLLAEAESVRYAEDVDERRAALLTRAKSVTEATADETGVAIAYFEWMRWLVREPDAAERLVEIRESHLANPFPALVCAWSHLREYADHAQWPADDEVLLHAIPRVASVDQFTETPEMKRLLQAALGDLGRARETEIWQSVPELRWVEDLGLGFAHYAEGDFDEAIAHLERVGAYNDLPFEPSLILSFAYSRRGDLDAAFDAIEPLLQRRPDHVTAARALASFYKRRAIRAQREHGGGIADLRESRRLLREISTNADSDVSLANLDLAIGLARARLGEDASEDFRRSVPVFEAGLEADPDDFGALGGLSQALMNLGDEQRAGELCDRMIAIRPESSAAFELRVGIAIMTMRARVGKEAITVEELEDIELRITQAEERFGSQPTMLYYRVNYSLLRAALAPTLDEDLQEWLQNAADGAARLREAAPDFQRARFLAWWTSTYIDEERRPSLTELFTEVVAVREPFERRGQRSPFDKQIAQRLEQLAGTAEDVSERAVVIEYAYELLKQQAAAEPGRAEWQTACARLASTAAELMPERARDWGRLGFEHAYAEAALEGEGADWSAVLEAGVKAFIQGEEDVLARTRDASQRATAARDRSGGASFWTLWLARANDEAAPEVEEIRRLRSTHAMSCNDFCWRVARESDLSAATYQRALSGMQLLAEHTDATGATLNTTGVLECRVGAWSDARATLQRSQLLNAAGRGISHPADAAFLAICSHELGESAEAERWRQEMEAGIEAWGLQEDPESRAFAAEVRARLGS